MRSRRVATVACAIAGLVLVVAGCGPAAHVVVAGERLATKPLSELSGGQIMDRALNVTAKAETLRIRTTFGTSRSSLVFDLRRTPNGDCFGQVTENAQTMSAIFTEDHVYIRASAAVWRDSGVPALAREMTRNPRLWARGPSDELYRGLCDVEKLPESVGLFPSSYDDLRAGPSHYGRESRIVVDLTSDNTEFKVTVAKEAPNYLVEIRSFGSTHAVLSEFGEPASVRIPTDDEVVAFISDVLGT